MTTYYVRPTNGSDAAAGTAFGTAFQTLQKALDSVAAGDNVRLCPEAVETTAVAVDVDFASGTEGSPILFEPGSTVDGSLDTSVFYTIQASATISGKGVLEIPSGATNPQYYQWKNVIFDANSNAANAFNSSLEPTANYWYFESCRFTGATADGFQSENNAAVNSVVFSDCEFDNNAGWGISNFSNTDGTFTLWGCKVHDNGGGGVESRAPDIIAYCSIYDNTGVGISTNASSDDSALIGNTVDGNSGTGVAIITGANRMIVLGNSSTNNGGYGFDVTGTVNKPVGMGFNHTHNNTSGAYNGTPDGGRWTESTGDPKYESTTDGSEDYRLQDNTSPLFEVLANGRHLGALGVTYSAGGGGGALYGSRMKTVQ